LTPFEHCNVLYGATGSGKSTIAALMADCAAGQASAYQAAFKRTGPNDDDNDEMLSLGDSLWGRVHVFNQEYVDRNLRFEGDDGSSAGHLLQVGEKQVDTEKRKTEIEKRQRTVDDELESAGNSQKTAEDSRSRRLTDTARSIANQQLGAVDSRYKPRTYDKGSVERLLKDKHEELAGWEAIDAEAQLELAISPALVEVHVAERSTRTADLLDDVRAALAATVTSEPLPVLVEHPDWATWVREGLAFHDERATCIYCENQLTSERRAELHAHFDDSFTELSARLARLVERIDQRAATASAMLNELPDQRDLDQTLRGDLSEAKEALQVAVRTVQDSLKILAAEVRRKQQHPFSALTPIDTAVARSADNARITAVATRHNALAAEGASRRRAAAEKFELATVGAVQKEAIALSGEAEAYTRQQKTLRGEKVDLSTELARLSAEDLDPQPLADSINRDLTVLLGRDEIQLTLAEQGYEITRSGRPARHLSEGERNAISLLYFLRSLEVHDITLADAIVVIDDPVSSLDSSNLLAASSFIWARLVNKCGQLFLFSHNFELFRTWSQLLKGAQRTLDDSGRKGVLYEVRTRHRTTDGRTRRTIDLRDWPKPPEASRLRSEYQYLFLQLLEGLADLQSDPREAQLMDAAALLPNATRRVLEGFLAFKRPQDIGNLRTQLRKVKPSDEVDEDLWQRVLRFADEYSHMEHADTDRHLERPEVLGHLHAVLLFIERVDPTHVTDMCEALGRDKPVLTAP